MPSSYERNWASAWLGPNISTDPKSKQSILRDIVIAYIYTTPNWIILLAKLFIIGYFLAPDKWYILLMVLLICSFAIEVSLADLTIYSAAVIWAKFCDGADITEKEEKIILRRFEPFNWLTNIVKIVDIFCVFVITYLVAQRLNYGFWLKWIDALVICLFFIGVLNLIPFGLNLIHWAKFISRINFKAQLLEEYKIYWENDTEENNDLTLQTSGALLLTTTFFLFLIGSAVFLKLNLLFDSFFILTMGGMLYLSISSSQSRISGFSTFYQKPYFCYASKILSFHIVHSLLLDGLWTVFIMSVIIAFNSERTFNWRFGILLLLSPFWSRFLFAYATLKIFKRFLNQQFTILVFRRFSEDFSELNKRLILPTLGAYGKILSINDKFLVDAKAGVNPDSEEIMNEYRNLPYATDANWKESINAYLRRVDVVVFQWNDLPTENMQWELQAAVLAIPENRIVFVCSVENADKIRQSITEIVGNELSGCKFITVNQNTTIKLFTTAIHNIFIGLHKEPRMHEDEPEVVSIANIVKTGS